MKTPSIDRDASIYVAGHTGLVGSAIVRALRESNFSNVVTATRAELDLRDQHAVNDWFAENRPRFVYLVAGTVGGILANQSRPAEFIYDNLMIHATVVHAAHTIGVDKLLYLGSSCIYPRRAPQPISESELLTGSLEPTNEAYAIAKIAGIKLCQSYRAQYGDRFITAMPTNLYGPHDNFDLNSSHVLPAMIRRFDDAKIRGLDFVEIWGSGRPRREFLHVDDLADACLYLMRHYDDDCPINVGTGQDLSILELATLVREIIAPPVEIKLDHTKPDGAPRKLLDTSRINGLGWHHRIGLVEGVRETYDWYLRNERKINDKQSSLDVVVPMPAPAVLPTAVA